MRELRVEADRKYMQTVQDFVNEDLENNPACSRKDVLEIHMVVDEIFGNIADYAYDDKPGPVIIAVDADKEGMIELTFSDEGKPYDPMSSEDPDVSLPARERSLGGLGIFMVKNVMDVLGYEYKNGRNIFTMRKRIGGKHA